MIDCPFLRPVLFPAGSDWDQIWGARVAERERSCFAHRARAVAQQSRVARSRTETNRQSGEVKRARTA